MGGGGASLSRRKVSIERRESIEDELYIKPKQLSRRPYPYIKELVDRGTFCASNPN
jgi:hypothetical protein